jgi:UDP-glucose 4-epimerase
MKALVIGGCGFIGSYVVDALLAQGCSVRVLDRQSERFRQPLAGVDYCIGSFADSMTVAEALSGVDTVFHLVSTTFPGTANLDPKADVRDNLINTISLLDLMVDASVNRIVFLSSGGTVYGPLDQVPVSEDHALRPINSYGIVKVAIEQYLAMYRSLHGISSLVVRASNPYGPRQMHSGVQGVISTFLKRVLDGEQIEIWGDGSVVRDYLYVTDLANFCVAAAASNKIGPFNVGCGQGQSLNEILDIICTVTSVDISPRYKPARPVDVPRSILNISRAETTFGWRPQVSLTDGIRQTWAWLQNIRR